MSRQLLDAPQKKDADERGWPQIYKKDLRFSALIRVQKEIPEKSQKVVYIIDNRYESLRSLAIGSFSSVSPGET